MVRDKCCTRKVRRQILAGEHPHSPLREGLGDEKTRAHSRPGLGHKDPQPTATLPKFQTDLGEHALAAGCGRAALAPGEGQNEGALLLRESFPFGSGSRPWSSRLEHRRCTSDQPRAA